MNKETFIRRLAGTMVILGAILTVWISSWFLIIPAFVGLNLVQSTYTGICPAETIYEGL